MLAVLCSAAAREKVQKGKVVVATTALLQAAMEKNQKGKVVVTTAALLQTRIIFHIGMEKARIRSDNNNTLLYTRMMFRIGMERSV